MNKINTGNDNHFLQGGIFRNLETQELSTAKKTIGKMTPFQIFGKEIVDQDKNGDKTINIDLLQERYYSIQNYWLNLENEMPGWRYFCKIVLDKLEEVLKEIFIRGVCNDIQKHVSPENGYPENYDNSIAIYVTQGIVSEVEKIIFSQPKLFSITSKVQKTIQRKGPFGDLKLSARAVQAIQKEVESYKEDIYNLLIQGGTLQTLCSIFLNSMGNNHELEDINLPKLIDYSIRRILNAFEKLDNPVYYHFIFYVITVSQAPELEGRNYFPHKNPFQRDPFTPPF